MQAFKLALQSLWASKGRSLLTMLGIIIGVSAVIVIIGCGNGIKIYMTESFQSMGSDQLTVSITGRGTSRRVDVDYMYAIAENNPELLDDVSPTAVMQATVKIDSQTLSSTSVSGVSEDYDSIKKIALASGRFLQFVDILRYQKVCVVGSYVAGQFSGNPVGQGVKLNGYAFTVVGVIEETATSEEGSGDDVIYIPYSTASRLSGRGEISSYMYTVVSEDVVAEAKSAIESALYSVYEDTGAYSVMSMSQILDMMTSMINVVIIVLASIAAISLIVGGVGIMNIMLISVSERIKEIGIRKAVGAKERNILLQFITEAATISTIGGAFGIGFGYLLCIAATQIVRMLSSIDISVTPSAFSIVLSVGVSVATGVLFGYLPAQKAAVLNPIDALRSE